MLKLLLPHEPSQPQSHHNHLVSEAHDLDLEFLLHIAMAVSDSHRFKRSNQLLSLNATVQQPPCSQGRRTNARATKLHRHQIFLLSILDIWKILLRFFEIQKICCICTLLRHPFFLFKGKWGVRLFCCTSRMWKSCGDTALDNVAGWLELHGNHQI